MKQLITNDIYYVGVSDRRIAQFENYIPISHGMSYNSYLIKADKTCLIDTADSAKASYFFKKLEETLAGSNLDYLIVLHMEPDHCSLIADLLLRYPDITIVSNAQVFKMIDQFFNVEIKNKIVVKDKDTFNIGNHELTFITAPLVHWPEVMFCYDKLDKVLFSADAFGSFGALSGNLFFDEVSDDNYFNESRRYYSNIVGKYGNNVVNAYNKIKDLEINYICPLHSYIWRKDFNLIIDKYLKWATYTPEAKEVVIIYASMYQNTEEVCVRLADNLAFLGLKNVKLYDISMTDNTYLISEMFRASHIILASPTHNLDLYPNVANLLHKMVNLGIKNRTFGIIENGTWNPLTAKLIRTELEKLTNINILEPVISIKSSAKEADLANLEVLANNIVKSINE